MLDRTHVPDKVEAYLLQVRHALFELIQAPDEKCIVSVEAYDDVALENDGNITAGQIKCSLSGNNPVSNRAISFWKTLYNWCKYIEEDKLAPDILKLIVVSNAPTEIGDIPKMFSDAKNDADANAAIEKAYNLLKRRTRDGGIASVDCKKYIDYCYNSEHKNTFLKVVKLFFLDLHNGTYDETLKSRFCEQPILEEYADHLFLTMLGWVTERVHDFTKTNKPAFISKKEYNDALRREIRGSNQATILQAVSTQPLETETEREIDRHDTYIKQLELINIYADDIYSAAADYLRTCAAKTFWAEKGLVTDTSFNNYHDLICRMWEAKKNNVNLKFNGRSNEEKGQMIYNDCKDNVLSMRLQGCEVPSYFGSGSLHRLANEPSDSPQIGWHPNYLMLIKGDKDNEQ